MATKDTENKESLENLKDKKDSENETDPNAPRSNFFDTKNYQESVKNKVEPFDIKELLTKGYLTQKVQLTKDQTVTFMTTEHGVEFLIDKIVDSYVDNGSNPNRISLTAYLAAHIQSIGDQPLVIPPMEYSEDNEEDYTVYLEQKIKKLMTYNSHFIKLLTTHYFWFQERVHEFFREEFMDSIENF